MKKNNRRRIWNLSSTPFPSEAAERECVYKLHCETADALFESFTGIEELVKPLVFTAYGLTKNGKRYLLHSFVTEQDGVREFMQHVLRDPNTYSPWGVLEETA